MCTFALVSVNKHFLRAVSEFIVSERISCRRCGMLLFVKSYDKETIYITKLSFTCVLQISPFTMSGTDICDYSSDSEYESDENTVKVNNITPYNFEPLASANQRHDVEELASTFLPTRANNIDWCKCGSCRPMETEEESKCCRDDDEVPL